MVYAVIDTNMLVSARISKNVSHKAHSFSLYLLSHQKSSDYLFKTYRE